MLHTTPVKRQDQTHYQQCRQLTQPCCLRSLDGLQVLVTRETVDEPSQYWLQTHHKDGPPTERQLSDFPHPHPS